MRILIVLTSHDQLGNTGRKTGFWLQEFAAPFYVFRDAGVQVTLASPRGGQPPIDPKSDLPENQTSAMARFKQDSEAQKALSQTMKLSDMRSENFVHERLPHSELHLIDSGHFAWEDAANEYAALVSAWWAGGYETCRRSTRTTAH